MDEENFDAIAEEKLTAEELTTVKSGQTKAAYQNMLAQKAATEAKLVEAELENYVLKLFMKYKLNEQDRIDDQTGKIVRVKGNDTNE